MQKQTFPALRQLLLLAVLACTGLCAATANANPFVVMDDAGLKSVRENVQNGTLTSSQKFALNFLLKSADIALKQKNPTVINKTITPSSGNKHDYLSISRYWWPNPKYKDGLPWVRHDGETNPDTQTEAVDKARLDRFVKGTKSLALSYYLTGKPAYAEKAASMIRTWFIDKETRMNPHLIYAQSVPGNPESRRAGILDGRLIPAQILDSITLISKSRYWTEADNTAMDQWLSEYLNWLTQSKLGRRGGNQVNNHGSWYSFQVAAIGYYLRDLSALKRAIKLTQRSFDEHFDTQGAQRHEIIRPSSFLYSCFNLQALSLVASISNRAGVPLWQYENRNKKSLKRGMDFIIPVITENKPWPYKSKGVNTGLLAIALLEYKHQFPGSIYDKVFYQIVDKNNLQALDPSTLTIILHRHPEFILARN